MNREVGSHSSVRVEHLGLIPRLLVSPSCGGDSSRGREWGVRSLYQGLASVLGVLIVALSNPGGLAQSYIFASIAGLPSLTPLLLTAVLAFVLGMLGYIFGDSLRRS